jgi:hypothetical protein|nr:MAG TPA: hypothetical protein [Caudoviricetes sp.]
MNVEYDALSKNIERLKAVGVRTLSIQDIEDLIVEATKVNRKIDDLELRKMEMEHQRRMTSIEAGTKVQAEHLKAIISFANATLKSILLINGGAIVAFIAFLSNNLRFAETDPLLAGLYVHLWKALVMFGLGAVAASLCYGASYISQSAFAQEYEQGLVSQGDDCSNEPKGRITGNMARNVAIVICVIAYGLTFGGIYFCAEGLNIFN